VRRLGDRTTARPGTVEEGRPANRSRRRREQVESGRSHGRWTGEGHIVATARAPLGRKFCFVNGAATADEQVEVVVPPRGPRNSKSIYLTRSPRQEPAAGGLLLHFSYLHLAEPYAWAGIEQHPQVQDRYGYRKTNPVPGSIIPEGSMPVSHAPPSSLHLSVSPFLAWQSGGSRGRQESSAHPCSPSTVLDRPSRPGACPGGGKNVWRVNKWRS
jgi:hypothetical protein